MGALYSTQVIVSWVLSLGLLGLEVFCLVDAVRHRAEAFPASGNQTKALWLVLLGVSVAVSVAMLPSFANMFSLIAVVVAGVYLTKVRPQVRGVLGGGPYGGW